MSDDIKLIESIKVENGKVENIYYHNKRFNRSRKELFGCIDELILSNFIEPPKNGLYKCRIIYSKQIESVEFIPYSQKNIRTFKIVEDNSIEYPYKFLKRDQINQLYSLKGDADEIIIIKNNLISDTSFSNIAFFMEGKWITPKQPLLKGTYREFLLNEKKIIEKDITKPEIIGIKKTALMNAMIGFYIIDNPIFF